MLHTELGALRCTGPLKDEKISPSRVLHDSVTNFSLLSNVLFPEARIIYLCLIFRLQASRKAIKGCSRDMRKFCEP